MPLCVLCGSINRKEAQGERREDKIKGLAWNICGSDPSETSEAFTGKVLRQRFSPIFIPPFRALNLKRIKVIDKKIFEAMPGIRVVLQPDAPRFTVVAVSNDFIQTSGLQKAEVIGKGIFELFPEGPEDEDFKGSENVRASIYHVIDNRQPFQLPLQRYDTRNADGVYTQRYWSIHNIPVLSEAGELLYIIHHSEDVTDKVKLEQRSEALEGIEKAYHLFMNAPVIIGIIKGDNYTIELANEGMLAVWGRTREVVGKPLFEAIPELKGQGFKELLDQVKSTGEPYRAFESKSVIMRNGIEEALYFDFVYQPYYEEEATSVTGVIGVAHDVTERVLTRQKVEVSRKELELAIEIADLGSFRLDLLTDQAINSDKVNEWFGYEAGNYSRVNGFKPIHPDDLERVEAAISQTLASEEQGRHDVSYRVVHPKTGVLRHLRSFGQTLFRDGKPYLIVGIIQDITQQVLQKQELEESEALLQRKVLERTIELEKLNNELQRSNASLEEFAYAASHDMKEPIRKIHYFSDRLKEQLQEKLNPEQLRLFQRMENAALRMGMLIDDLLTYSHVSKGVTHMEDIDLNEKVQSVLEDLEVEIENKKARVETVPLPSITGHRRQIQQLFQNLLSNALKYSRPEVTPLIRIGYASISGSELPRHLAVKTFERSFHHISISDNGIGFEQDDAERIFNVFIRLHGNTEYRGSGVGLSIVRKVVDNHHGLIWAESAPGKGSVFHIVLPAGG